MYTLVKYKVTAILVKAPINGGGRDMFTFGQRFKGFSKQGKNGINEKSFIQYSLCKWGTLASQMYSSVDKFSDDIGHTNKLWQNEHGYLC